MTRSRTRGLSAAAACLALLFGGNATQAQPDCPLQTDVAQADEMRFTVRERPDGPPVLLAEGLIVSGTIPRLQAALDHFQGREIWLNSPGGYVGADRDAGRLIRSRGLRTRVPAGSVCRGACNFMFMGGTERIVEDGGFFIANMFRHSGDRSNYVDIGGASQMLATVDYDFLIRMGVSPRLLSDIMYREPAGGGRCLTRAELDEYRVTTRPSRRN